MGRKFRRPTAKVRRTWNTNIRASWCNPYLVDISPCNDGRSATSVIFQLVNQVILEDQFSDAASVKRIVGDLFFRPVFGNTPPQVELPFAFAVLDTYQVFAGLRKRDVNAQGAVVDFNPIDDDADFGDAKWLRTWQHAKLPASQFATSQETHTAFYPVYKPNVHTYVSGAPGVPACSPLTTGTGFICIETTGTVDCEACDHTTEALVSRSPSPALYHFHIDWRRKMGVRLRENEELVLQFDFAHPDLNAYAANDPVFHIFGGIKTLMQY